MTQDFPDWPAANQLTLRKLLFSWVTDHKSLNTMTWQSFLNGLPFRYLHIVIHGFVFWNIQNRLVSKICKLADASASLLQSQFDTHHLFPLLTLTRSVKTSYLSQYLQTLTQTIDKLIIPYNNLKPCIIQRRSHGQPHPTWQILRHTRLATGTISWLKNRDNSRIAEPGNVTWF